MYGIFSKGTIGLLPTLFRVTVFQWEPSPKLIFLSSQPDNLASPFCSSQPHRTRWCALVLIEQCLSAESKILHMRELHVGNIENSASYPHINHLTSLTVSFSCLRSYYPSILLYCMLILWFSWELYLYWTPTEQLLGQLFLSLQSIASLALALDLMKFLGNCSLSVAFFLTKLEPRHQREQLQNCTGVFCMSLEEGKTVVHCPLMTAFHMYLSHNPCCLPLAVKSGCRSWIWRVERGFMVAEGSFWGAAE